MTRFNSHFRTYASLFGAALVSVACAGSDGSSNSNSTDNQSGSTVLPDESDNNSLPALDNDLQDNSAFYSADGYDEVTMLDVLVRTATVAGPCTTEDISGCSLADILSDNDGNDEFEPEIDVHFSSADYSDDTNISNAILKQRGDTSRQADQKSFAVKLDKGLPLWRNERRLQLNKHPYDVERIRNKLSFDLMRGVEHLNSLRTQFVHLKIEDNGQTTDYGVYTHVEYVGDEYLANRGYDPDSAIYKTVNFTFDRLPDRLQIDSDGEPVDEDLFERNLEIKNGDDHSALIEMLDALNDPDSDKAEVLEKHFNENNLVSWLATNILLGNANTVYENYYVFNPTGSDDFYLLPWDYDSAFKTEADPDNYTGQEQLRRRMSYGVSKWWESRLIRTWLQQPGAMETLQERVESLYNGALSPDRVSALISQYQDTIQPYLLSAPDLQYLYGSDDQERVVEWLANIEDMPGRVEENYQNFVNDPGWPMSFALKDSVNSNGTVRFSWSPSYDFQGDALAYKLEVAATPAFENIIYTQTDIPDETQTGSDGEAEIQLEVPSASLGSGTYYWRVIAFEADQPDQNWRPAYTRVSYNGEYYYGTAQLTLD
ncbi:CotH kinase family protein [Granulosicoccaceae sp. 1_MG-2023]|nr:CotH kinase family protein [Granulosicoccaceae sp. 1_MG-2023]